MASLTGIPPWLDYTPQTFLGAMEAGTQAGSSLRGQDIAKSEAADRLKLAYDSLSANERMQSQAAQARLQQGQSAMALRQAQLDGQQDYRDARLDQMDRAQQLREYQMDRAQQLRESMQDRLQQVANTSEAALAERVNALSQKLPQQQAMALQDLYIRRRTLQKALEDPATDSKSLPGLQKQIDDLGNQINSFGQTAATASTPAAPALSAQPPPSGGAAAALQTQPTGENWLTRIWGDITGSDRPSTIQPISGPPAPTSTGTAADALRPGVVSETSHDKPGSAADALLLGALSPEIVDLSDETGGGGTPLPGTSTAPMPPTGPPQAAIQYLQNHPEAANQFDAKYGEGSAQAVLGQQSGQ